MHIFSRPPKLLYRLAFGGGALLALALLPACGSSSSSAAPSSAATTPTGSAAGLTGPQVDLTEMKVTVDATFKPGSHTFTIKNSGTVPHELLVFKSDLAVAQYPTKNGGIDEEGTGIVKVSDGDNIAPGDSQTRTIDLKPGKYVFVCNLPGHFSAGMYTEVTVA